MAESPTAHGPVAQVQGVRQTRTDQQRDARVYSEGSSMRAEQPLSTVECDNARPASMRGRRHNGASAEQRDQQDNARLGSTRIDRQREVDEVFPCALKLKLRSSRFIFLRFTVH
jgi:hypothetical protein